VTTTKAAAYIGHTVTTRLAVFSSIATLALLGAGCGGTERPTARPVGGSSAACAAAVEWRSTTYFGTKVKRELRLARSLGEGSLPPCNDGGGSEPERSVKLAAIEGVSSDQAVAVAGDPSTVYVDPGYFMQPPHTPLHDLMFGPSDSEPNERSACERGHTTTADVRAVIRAANFGNLTVTLLAPKELPHDNWIFSDAHTVITGGGPTPHVSAGDIVRASVLVCRHAADPHFLKLVATRLTLPSNS